MRNLIFLTCALILTQIGHANCQNFYIGVDGGFAYGLVQARSDFSVNNINTPPPAVPPSASTTYNCSNGPGFHVGANAGYWLCPSLRTDISYSYIKTPVRWETQYVFSSPDFLEVASDFFAAYNNCHLILWNGYYHLNQFFNCVDFSPYISGGIGLAVNSLGKTDVRNNGGILIGRINNATNTNFAARFGLGFLKPFCNWVLDMGFNFQFIGAIKTGTTLSLFPRADLPSGLDQPINRHQHFSNWLGTFYVGIKYGL